MPIRDLKSIIPSYLKDVWYLNPVALCYIRRDRDQKIDEGATISLSGYKQFYK